MEDAAELKRHIYDIVGALHSVHDEPGPGINECSKAGKWARAS